jgi:copper(I)-binding protein
MTLLFRALAALACLALPALAHDGLHIDNAFARASAQSAAVFMTITNHGTADDRLIAARTDAADLVELHTHSQDADGVMQMLPVPEGFVIPAGGEHALARGGDHVMLMGLTRPLGDGDSLTLILTFEHAGEVTVAVPVDNARKADPGHEGHGTSP